VRRELGVALPFWLARPEDETVEIGLEATRSAGRWL